MKNLRLIPLLLLLVTFATAGFAQEKATVTQKDPAATEVSKAETKAMITFDEESYEFGDVKQGEVVSHVFKFKNTGTEDLKIEMVKASCGCTTPTWPKEAIKPGQEGEIPVKFNTTGKMGMQNKAVTVISNAGTKVVYLKGSVKSPQPAPQN